MKKFQIWLRGKFLCSTTYSTEAEEISFSNFQHPMASISMVSKEFILATLTALDLEEKESSVTQRQPKTNGFYGGKEFEFVAVPFYGGHLS